MNARTPPPSIPVEALARQARLQAALRSMEEMSQSQEPASLQDLRVVIGGHSHSSPGSESLIEAIVADDLVEEATELLRASRRNAGDKALVEALASRLAPMAAKAQQRRAALWQMDTRRASVRFSYSKEDGALGFDDGDLHVIFLQAFRLEGFRLALDLGKRPRPLLTVSLPLPAGVGSLAESMDAVLKQEPMDDPASQVARLNHRLPCGLRVHQWNSLPGYASAVGDLAVHSHWRWEVPAEDRSRVGEKAAAFLETKAWSWERATLKSEAPLDLRRILSALRWEDGALCFATEMGPFQAINSLKMLGAIVDLDPVGIKGLVRTSVDLKPDARLGQSERFEPKLKNMYEDAVLLGGGSNIVLVDEDDDEPIVLGPQSETT